MKAIISQPMKGKTEAQVRAEREAAIKHLNESGYEVVDTVFPDFTNKGNIPLKYLAKSIEAIADVDLVYFIGDWKSARGCRIEFDCCLHYEIKTEFE
jgi:Asp-tRNA(Asn)/Glu-tRNA(Gln) amidotransferase A subunit family amidase